MKLFFSVLSAVLILLLMASGIIARYYPKSIGRSVAILNFSLFLPLAGSMMTDNTHEKITATVGCYMYFIGLNLVLLALMRFATEYCKNSGTGHKVPKFIYILLWADIAQLLLNPFTGHAFSMEEVDTPDGIFYRMIPYAGQIFHRIVDYGIFVAVLLVFIVMTFRMPSIYKERYSVIMYTLFFAGLWQTFCISSKIPVDHATIGFGIAGIIIFYFSLYYRPLKLLDRMLSDVVSEMPEEALFLFDPNGRCIWANSLGSQIAEVQKGNLEATENFLVKIFGESVKNHGDWSDKTTVQSETELKYYTLESHSFTDEKDRLTGSYLRIRDVTREQQEVKKGIYEATHDRLTGLYTREYLYQSISEISQSFQERQYLIVFVDIKNFKIVNDVFGNEFGDYALQCIAEWVRRDMSEYCRYGRLVGDTFGICVPEEEFAPEEREKELSNFIIQKDNTTYQLLIHLGVYRVEPEDNDVSVMFDRAHLALSTIQDEYKTHIAYYNKEIREKILWNQNISSQLGEAIQTRAVRPYLQPIADREGHIVGAEALARWIHPEHGFMSPALFIPIFEKNGMIAEVDKHIWRCACEVLSEWQKENRNLFISVNISPKDFYFIDVISEIQSLVKEFQIPPEILRIEITETVMMTEAENRMQILEDFRKAGFIVEMDDFGSGYSSLNMLKDMPVDVLKIDMKFLSKTGDKDKAKTIVKNIIHLSEELGISALTEGVETKEQYQILSQMGCSLFQGYYFAKPLPVEEFEKML